jgi:uncharacterized membrane protein
MEFTSQQEKRITEYFRIGIFIKGALSLIEIIAGTLALFVPVSSVTNFVIALAQGELIGPAIFYNRRDIHCHLSAQQGSHQTCAYICVA